MKKKERKSFWMFFVCTILVLLVVFILPSLFFSFESMPIIFNQHIIESVKQDYGTRAFGETARSWISYQTLAWNSLFHSSAGGELDVNNSREVFDYVFDEIPYYALIYPTETYYYYKIPEYGIAGNLRFVDIDKGILYFAYYYIDRPHEEGGFEEYGLKDGVFISQVSEYVYKVSFRDKTVYFRLPSIVEDVQKKLNLIESEEFVAKIQDESGVLFYLLFNHDTNSFYYVFDEEKPIADSFSEVLENVFVGNRTGYAYYFDKENDRKILFGVGTDNIWMNNYFDGPFDQVLPKTPLRDKVYLAYPYTQYLHGLDEEANFIDFEGSRIAISAYTDYVNVDGLRERVENCTSSNKGSVFWTCLTYEPKKDFHKTLPDYFYEDGTCKSNCLLEVE